MDYSTFLRDIHKSFKDHQHCNHLAELLVKLLGKPDFFRKFIHFGKDRPPLLVKSPNVNLQMMVSLIHLRILLTESQTLCSTHLILHLRIFVFVFVCLIVIVFVFIFFT